MLIIPRIVQNGIIFFNLSTLLIGATEFKVYASLQETTVDKSSARKNLYFATFYHGIRLALNIFEVHVIYYEIRKSVINVLGFEFCMVSLGLSLRFISKLQVIEFEDVFNALFLFLLCDEEMEVDSFYLRALRAQVI